MFKYYHAVKSYTQHKGRKPARQKPYFRHVCTAEVTEASTLQKMNLNIISALLEKCKIQQCNKRAAVFINIPIIHLMMAN
jgi:hypothetical protein